MSELPVRYDDIVAAHARIAKWIHRTPVITCQTLDDMIGARVFLKCENLQKIGAFKIRGACNAVLCLRDQGYRGPLATHSSGNHGAALALAARWQQMQAHIVMPKNSSRAKFDAVKTYGGQITTCGAAIADRDRALSEVVQSTNAEVVHPFDDARVIAGQGTAALEFLEEVPDLDVIMTPIGGGGLMSGTAIASRAIRANTKIVGVEPDGANVAYRSVQAGSLVSGPPADTIADGLRAGLAPSTFSIIQKLVDEVVTVSDQGIIRAMRALWTRTKLVVEPSSAVPVAALLEKHVSFPGQKIGVIVTGGNVDLDALPWMTG